ncbi:TPA: helix-turn-helix domain-containing protein [Clostridium perfringens]|nr:helix-turn-helix domain-containing protein [Clostridium perfringens]
MENNFIQINGIMSQGYGFSPKMVMRDKRLTIEAKAIYAYMSSFAGAGLTAFPTVELQLAELGISKSRYYKHRKLLEDLGYITVKQTRVKGESGKIVNGKNIYTIEQFPIEKKDSEVPQNKEAQENGENTKFSEIPQNEYSHNEPSQNAESNSNSLNSNNLNNILLSSSSEEEEEEKKEQDYRKEEVRKLLQVCQLNNYKLSKKDIEALLVTYNFDKISKAIVTAASTNNTIKNYKGYIVSVLNDIDRVKKVDINITKEGKESKAPGANFTQREDYDYDNLEKKLLGW